LKWFPTLVDDEEKPLSVIQVPPQRLCDRLQIGVGRNKSHIRSRDAEFFGLREETGRFCDTKLYPGTQ